MRSHLWYVQDPIIHSFDDQIYSLTEYFLKIICIRVHLQYPRFEMRTEHNTLKANLLTRAYRTYEHKLSTLYGVQKITARSSA